MSRLTDLLRQARLSDPQLGAALEEEVSALMKRRSFGLVFERHQPEAVELPHQRPRRGSKVRILPPRGETKKSDPKLWRVTKVEGTHAHLAELNAENPQTQEVPIENLVVVAEFQDTIYPGLVETGRVERGGDKPCHTVINGENFHALEMLTYTHRHKIDAIYIDPPYNTGARDWKYNNDYVESDDDYRHSKWLSFMEKRLLLASELLNPDDSVLIVTIDEKEYLRLGLLLEQVFPEARIQMISTLINPAAVARKGKFGRTDEYIFVVLLGSAHPKSVALSTEWVSKKGRTHKGKIRWDLLRRSGTNTERDRSPGTFYPFYLDPTDGHIVGIGEVLPLGKNPEDAIIPPNVIAIWPYRKNGSQGVWQMTPENAKKVWKEGFLRPGDFKQDKTTIYYIKPGEREKITKGIYEILGYDRHGVAQISDAIEVDQKTAIPGSQWTIKSHDSSQYGSRLLADFLPMSKFPFPKSLYAVEDSLRFFVKDKPDAVVLDFFSGSGTTAHAVMRLNKQDGGRRQCISVTNNEVSADEQVKLRKQGLRPGDPEWEALGICDYITKPRIQAAITGLTPEGEPIKGDYKFTDEFPMADGFEENARFFTLTYESPLAVKHNRAFAKIAPMLWLRAGARGKIIDSLGTRGWDIAESYAVLENISDAEAFFEELSERDGVETVFVVTDDDSAYQMVARELPEQTDVVRLYESYLQNFEINQGVML